MTSNESLSEIIALKEQQLTAAQTEMNARNRGKYKGSSNASVSQIYVDSIKRELADLYARQSHLAG
ncbi:MULTISPECIES: hypothetical protein [Aeromonas]|uniref:hypothetical protein n=1 Tax=Aeromonas TaxID=642 RepID=UPI00227AC225|nr:hypothetical protein [Aeromonas dhakensis]WAG13105.1 hypothetical protein NRZ32_08225 [Aeromonas dhakensis]